MILNDWCIVGHDGEIMSSFGENFCDPTLLFFLENFWSKHFFTATSHLTTAYACSQMSARCLVVYCLIGLHFDVLPHGTDILVSNVILLYVMSLNIRDPFDLWTTLYSLTISLVKHALSFMVYEVNIFNGSSIRFLGIMLSIGSFVNIILWWIIVSHHGALFSFFKLLFIFSLFLLCKNQKLTEDIRYHNICNEVEWPTSPSFPG